MKAIVAGAGICGLALSCILSDFYEEIYLLDPGIDENGHKLRDGTPQAGHLHVLLKEGQDILFELFPDLRERISADCELIDWGNDTTWESFLGVFPQTESGIKTYSFSRNYLQALLLEKCQKRVNIKFIPKKQVSLLYEKKQVLGGIIEGGEKLKGDVFICFGANSSLQKLFKTSSIPMYREKKVRIDITYRSELQRNEGHNKQYYSQLFPPYTDQGVVRSPIERGGYIETKINYKFKKEDKSYPNIFTKRYSYRRKPCSVRGLLILGDSLCSLNPVFGQGMSVAFLQVRELKNALMTNKDRSHKLQNKMIRLSYGPWILSTLAFQTNKNFKSFLIKKLYKVFIKNEDEYKRFLSILHLKKPFYSLFTINLLKRIIL